MILSLKRKFILLGALALFLLLALIVAGMNLVNFANLASASDEILDLIARRAESDVQLSPFEDFITRLPDQFSKPQDSPELFYESRYFSVTVDREGYVLNVTTDQIAAVNEEEAVAYADEVLKSNSSRGFFGPFRYRCEAVGETTRITFLDRTRELDQAQSFLFTSILISALGFAAVFLLLCFFSGRIVRPIAENYEKQRRFVTDASHEIRTPLSIIRTNADLLELELGENESISDIRRQSARLASLTEDLILLSQSEESTKKESIDFPLSEVVLTAAREFASSARAMKKQVTVMVEPMLTLRGSARAIAQLTSLLLDNALKYTPEQGTITLCLSGTQKHTVLTVENPAQNTLSPEELSRLFDRFYRPDPSRNSSCGGHGIGLSVARAVTESHGGKISASQDENGVFKITVLLPPSRLRGANAAEKK